MVAQIRKKSRVGRNLAPDPGARNFPIFKTPKKFTSFYSKDFLPKLIFLRKGVHHPKFRFSGVREICGPGKKGDHHFLDHFSKIFRDLVLFVKSKFLELPFRFFAILTFWFSTEF